MRAVVIVIDGLGIGALPDARAYNDCGANTLAHICELFPESESPNLTRLGIGNCIERATGFVVEGCKPSAQPTASFGHMAERSFPERIPQRDIGRSRALSLKPHFNSSLRSSRHFLKRLCLCLKKESGKKSSATRQPLVP